MKTLRVGILETSSPDPDRLRLWDAFQQRLREQGHAGDRNLSFEFRWADGKPERLPALAAELVNLKVDVIVSAGTPAAFAAQRATATVPIVMATGVSVGTELDQAIPRSATNVTGLSDLAPGLSEKRLALLGELVRGVGQFALLWDKSNPSGSLAIREFQDAAARLRLTLRIYGVAGLDELPDALSAMARDGARGFIVVPSAMFFAGRKRLVDLALEHRLPAMFVRSEYAEIGGLMAYGAPILDNYLRAAGYVDRLLKGARPADLPVEQPVAFELVINLKTAKALGLEVPEKLRLGARLL